jgi:hypothetical protein
MPFQAGENWNGNATGRPKGRVNRRTQEVLDLIRERGDVDPLIALSDIVTKSQVPEHRIAAANILAPYVHSKRGTIPSPRFLPDTIEVPEFTSISQAEDFLAHIPTLLGRGELDSQSAMELSTLTKNWLDAIYARQGHDLKLQAQGTGDATIRITGGMPALPGTNINMTNKLSLDHNGHVIDHMPEPDTVQAEIPVHGSVEPPKDPTEDLSELIPETAPE